VADAQRIAERLEALWRIARGSAGGADRPAYSPAEAEAMRLVAGWASELGLRAAIDRHGNLWALPGEWDGPLVTAGSHVDTVPDGGRYDGALGTVLGLELAATLSDLGERGAAARAGVLVCAAEEAPRFGAGTVGSRLLCGTLSEDELAALHDADGASAATARDAYLALLADLPRIGEPPLDRIRAHAEIHVALRFGPPELGVVTRVASPRRLEIVITGEPGHAGEVSMEDRRDALAAASEIVLAVEAAARAQPPQTVATVGTLAVSPGAVSVVPGGARLGVDMRAVDADSLDRLEGAIRDAVTRIADARGVSAQTALTRAGSPVAMDPGLVQRALAAARDHGFPAGETWSGAGHDAQHIGQRAPALLLFVPLHGGQSHTPQEGAEMGEIVKAAEVAQAVLAVAGG
jgi:hydantoinase/carbamoylase family amidase